MGSENAPGRLRFDFPSPHAVPATLLAEVEARVNDVLAVDLPVHAHQMSQDEARSLGAMALFGEKYGDIVRVVSVGDWAHELCGGTHAERSGQVGVVTFLSEGSIGAGVRRVEALVGTDAYRFLAREHLLVSRLTDLIKARPEELPDRVEAMIAAQDAERELAKARRPSSAPTRQPHRRGHRHRRVPGLDVRHPEGTRPATWRLALRARGLTRDDVAVLMVGAAVHEGRSPLA
jgi:alanyl-tRNA synthetase